MLIKSPKENTALFCAKIKSQSSRYEGSQYKINVINLCDVYEVKDGIKIPLCQELTIRASRSMNQAIHDLNVSGCEEVWFTAKWEDQPNTYIGTVLTVPLRKINNVKPIRIG